MGVCYVKWSAPLPEDVSLTFGGISCQIESLWRIPSWDLRSFRLIPWHIFPTSSGPLVGYPYIRLYLCYAHLLEELRLFLQSFFLSISDESAKLYLENVSSKKKKKKTHVRLHIQVATGIYFGLWVFFLGEFEEAPSKHSWTIEQINEGWSEPTLIFQPISTTDCWSVG